jgi:uncharacterized protein (TIGR00730 family)
MANIKRKSSTQLAGRPTQDEQLLASRHFVDTDQAGRDKGFTDTDPWRVLRIMGEFTEGFDALAALGPAVTIFGSARVRPGDDQYEAAVQVARNLGQAGLTIITGGGPGIMEAGNKGAHLANAPSVGLNVELPFEQGVNEYVDLALEFRYFFVRKTMFVKYAQGFVIFPGGFGTMDELFESLTLIQTGKVRNFPVVLFGSAYWHGLLEWLHDTMLAEAKISPADLALPIISDSVDETCDIIVRSIRDSAWRDTHESNARKVTREVLGTSSRSQGR